MWQVWIKIGIPQGSYPEWFNTVVNLIRSQVHETISLLESNGMIDWYHFLIHPKGNDSNAYFHLRLSLKEGINPKDLIQSQAIVWTPHK